MALFSYLCGDLTCALMGRQLSGAPPHLPTAGSTSIAPAGPTNPGELMALLNAHRHAAPPPDDPLTPDLGRPPVALPTLLGTLQGHGQSLAILQAAGSQDPTVVALGEDFQGFTITEVGPLQACLRDTNNQEYTISMLVTATTQPQVLLDASKGP